MAMARAGLGEPVGVVPTMGGLHAGHVALLRAARRECASVIATLFVNPTQFASHEVADAYPHDEDADFRLFRTEGVDVAFAPIEQSVYPSGFATRVGVPDLGGQLEGASRPGHFEGVATVVTILFNLTRPAHAYFGQKDWQQARVVKQLVGDLGLGFDIRIIGTVRDSQGLALGTRNTMLSAPGLEAARVLWRALAAGADAWGAGERHAEVLERLMRRELEAEPGAGIDYAAARDPLTLSSIATDASAVALLVAADIEGVRLIDNVVLGEGLIDVDPADLLSDEGDAAALG